MLAISELHKLVNASYNRDQYIPKLNLKLNN